MPVHHTADARIHEFDGGRWTSYASPSRGSRQLCGWHVEIPAGTPTSPHRVSHEEIGYVLGGRIALRHDGREEVAEPGDVLVIPPDTEVRVTNAGDRLATMWVTTSVGFEATMPDGPTFSPPWVR